MKKILTILLITAIAAGCTNSNKVSIKGTFTGKAAKTVYLERNDVDKITIIDSAKVKNGHFSFTTKITEPEFYQVNVSDKDFITLLALPSEKIKITFGEGSLIKSYSVTGSKGSEQVRELDIKLIRTNEKLDSLRNIYSSLSQTDISLRGPALEKEFTGVINKQRLSNIEFILANMKSMATIKALYQRIDESAYVLYQPRDLQFLKIVSDSLRVVYPNSKHVKALIENVKTELNQMYFNRLESIATQSTSKRINPDLKNINGERVSIESLRGKYVLLTFWTTTSEDCATENRLLKTLYNLYKKKGLEIYQISLDTDVNRWKNVVRYEEIPWISVIEDDPLNPRIAQSLAITTLPSNFLIDREGNMINTNLHDRNLQIKMDQLFNK
jgi:peroxiredoxin